MNAVVQFDASVPAFLRNANFLALNQKAAAGLGGQGASPRLSFRGSRFRWIAADGTETPLSAEGAPGNNSMTVDVIVLDASDHVSKFYYDKAYDPNADDMSPACFSDNGVGPSSRAQRPQSLLCGNCPHAVWGSKVTPTGSKIKACSDVKKLAVIPVSNVDGPAFMVGIPAASLKTWTAAVNAVSQRGIPIPALVFRIGFDPDPAYPKLTFNPVRWLTEDEANSVSDLFGSDECAELVGRKDMPITVMPGGAAPTGGTYNIPHGGASVTVEINRSGAGGPSQAPVFTAPAPEPAPAFLQQPAPAAPAAQDGAPRRRRRTNAEIAAANAQAAAQQNTGGAPQAPAATQTFPAMAQPAPAAPQAPTAGGADLNALLDQVMAGKK